MPGRMPVATRLACMDDVSEVARLCTQLGYPVTAEEMAARMSVVISAGDSRVFVVAEGVRLLGWIAIDLRVSLETGRKAEIVGLVVDAGARRLGVGRALTEAAEDWARQQGFDLLVVRSNTARVESHPFYLKHGYRPGKTQQVYSKPL